MFKRPASLFLVFCVFASCLSAFSADVPSILPKPDKTPPADGKVKVYILAGQSNMVGFGTLTGARPCYPSIYLSADPAVLPSRMPVGPSALLPHGVYQEAKENSPKGAKASVYSGAYSPDADYDSMKPVEEAVVALGTVSAELPGIKGPNTVVVRAFIDVPMTGMYEMHAGFEDSSYAIVTLDGKEVYRREVGKDAVVTKVNVEQGKRYPIKIIYMKSGSAAFWLKQVDIQGKGDLETVIKEGKFSWFVDDEGNYTVRNDVIYWDVRTSKEEIGSGGPLNPKSNAGGKFIGPEVPFGYVVGTYHEEPVLLIESSMGNRALSFDFRPPSSGRTDPDNEWEGLEYRLMVEGVHKVLKNLDKIVPNYKGQGYEIVGFGWWQGHKDSGQTKEEYEKHLVNLIQDLRNEFKAPDMRAVVASVGFHGNDLPESWQGVFEAQMAVGDPKQHPEFKGNVVSVDTRGFWRPQGESPQGVDYHYNKNAETYSLTGDAMGRAMVELLGGKVETLKLPSQAARNPMIDRIYSTEIVQKFDNRARAKYDRRSENPTDDEYAEMAPVLRPMILDGIVPEFLETAFGPNSRSLGAMELKDIVKGKKPSKMPESIESQLDSLIGYYEAAGISDYSWKTFGPEMKSAKWYYFSFDPPEKQAADKSDRYREITFPKGMENWFAVDFNAAQAGWKEGKAPFGQMDGKLAPRKESCYQPLCGCDEMPATLWEKEVLLMRQTFDVPAVKDGHAYRLLLGGAGCDRSGEGYAVYVNGKLLSQSKGGFFRNEGVRGAYLYEDILPEFKGGKVAIAVINFLRYTHHRNQVQYLGEPVLPNGHVSLWMQEAKLSPNVLAAAGAMETEKK